MKLSSISVALLSGILALGLAAGEAAFAGEPAKRNLKKAGNAKYAERAFNQITIDCQDGVAVIGFNAEGNMIRFEGPLGFEHVGVGGFSEGYVFRWDHPLFGPVIIHDVNGAANEPGVGWEPPAHIPGGNFSVRYSLDASVKLTQTFTPDCDQRKVVIEHKVQNCTGGSDPICSGGGVSLNNVCLARQVDFDVDTGGVNGFAGFINNHAASRDAYIAWNDKADAPAGSESHSTHLSILNPQRGPVFSTAKVTNATLDTNCPAVDEAFDNPRQDQDDGGRIEATTADMAPGESVTLLLEYKRD